MQGKVLKIQLFYDPEIEKTERKNWRKSRN